MQENRSNTVSRRSAVGLTASMVLALALAPAAAHAAPAAQGFASVPIKSVSTVTVSANGKADFTTIKAALSAVTVGGTVLVADGEYTEDLTIAKAVTVKGSGDFAVLKGTITITAAKAAVSDLRLDGSSNGGGRIDGDAITVSAASVTLDALEIRYFKGWGVNFKRGGNGSVSDSHLYAVSGGMSLRENSVIENNKIERLNTYGDKTMPGDAFRVFGSNTVIRGNHVFGGRSAEISPASADIVESFDASGVASQKILIENNVFTGWYSQGITLDNVASGAKGTFLLSDWTIRNNVFEGFASGGIGAGKPKGGVPRVVVQNNLFVGAPGAQWGVYFYGVGGSGINQNNIVQNVKKGSWGAANDATMTSDHNLASGAPAPLKAGAGDVIGAAPLFRDAAKLDFRPASGSRVIDAGTAVSATVDADGGARVVGTSTDLGPYEYSATATTPVTSPPPVATPAPAPSAPPVSNPAPSAPFSLQGAINSAPAGSTVSVPDGTYVGDVIVSKPIVLTAAGKAAVVRGLLTVTAPGVTVRGLGFDGSGAAGGYISGNAVTISAPSATISGISVRSYKGWAVNFARGGSGTLLSSYLYNVSGGVNVRGDSRIEGNEIERINTFGDTSQSGDAFRIFGSNSVIRNNYVHDTVAAEVMPVHADMIQSFDDTGIESRNILIEGNRFAAWSHQGIMIENDAYGPSGRYLISNWTVRNNQFTGFTTWGILAGKVNGGIPNMVVENNTFSGNPSSGGYWGVYFSGIGGSGVQQGNTFANLSRGSFGVLDGATMTSR